MSGNAVLTPLLFQATLSSVGQFRLDELKHL